MTRNLIWQAPLLIMAATVSACMTATPYQPYEPELTAGIHGGYSEQNLSSGRYLVRFHGNQLTARDRVEGYLLYRAAELTIQNGSNWFLIVDRHTEHDVETYIRPDPLYQPWYGSAYGYWRPHWRYYRKGYGWDVWHPEADPSYWADRPAVTRIESFEAEAEIVLGQGQRPENEPRAFEARQVIASLGPTLERPRGQK